MKKIRADVKKHGQCVLFVGPGPDSDPYSYTIGRGKRGLPELLLAAPVRPEVGRSILNTLDKLMPEALPSGSTVNVGGSHPVMVVDAIDDVKALYTLIDNTFHGDPNSYRVQQVLLCDPDGNFPPDCAEPYSKQPNLRVNKLH